VECNTLRISAEVMSPIMQSIDDAKSEEVKPAEGACDSKTKPLSEDVVTGQAIVALLRALRAPSIKSPELVNLGITQEWLASHAEDIATRMGSLGEPNDVRQQQFFKRSFEDPALVKKLLSGIIDARWTDDSVWIHVKVKFADGKQWQAETTSLTPYVLPWTRTEGGRTSQTYNSDLSRAVAELLPLNAINRNRLDGTSFADRVVSAVANAVKQRWQEIGAEDEAGGALATLRKRYEVRRTEVSDHIGLTHGPDRYSNSPHETSLQADVREKEFPTNLVVGAVFPFEKGSPAGVNDFMRIGNKYERLVLENSWVMASLRSHPDLGAWLVFVRDASMSEKAMRMFAADMHALGREDLIDEVSAHRYDVSLLNYYGNELILFPDHHAIIWRWGKYRELFSWPSSSIKTQICENYPTVTEGCTAAVVDAQGQLQR
jgi:hypothetical protein